MRKGDKAENQITGNGSGPLDRALSWGFTGGKGRVERADLIPGRKKKKSHPLFRESTKATYDAKHNINYKSKSGRQLPPAAKKRLGRQKGTVNVVTATIRAMFTEFVGFNIAGAQALYEQVARKNPAQALSILTNMAEFVVPKLNRTELNVQGDSIVTPHPIQDANEAANVYVAIMGNKNLDLTRITFDPPNVVAVQEASSTNPIPQAQTPTNPIPQGPTNPIPHAQAHDDNVVSMFERLGK